MKENNPENFSLGGCLWELLWRHLLAGLLVAGLIFVLPILVELGYLMHAEFNTGLTSHQPE